MAKTDVRIQIRDFILDTGTAAIMGTSPIGKLANDTVTISHLQGDSEILILSH